MAEWTKADIFDLIFQLNDKTFDVKSMPLSVRLKVTDIIDCYNHKYDVTRRQDWDRTDDPNIVTFKLRDNGCEHLIEVNKFDRVCK